MLVRLWEKYRILIYYWEEKICSATLVFYGIY